MRALVVALVLAVSASASADPDPPPDYVLRGMVVNGETGAPVEGALVIAQHETATTDRDGDFAVTVGGDEHFLIITAPGYTMRSIAVEDAARIAMEVKKEKNSAPGIGEVIEVSGTAPKPYRPTPLPPPPPPVPAAPQSYRLSADDLRILPGTANDALRAAQILPGVARLPYSFGGIVMRGTSPRDNVVYLDGVEVPIAFHFGGISSFYPSNMLDSISVSNSGIEASYGRAQGGMIEMTSREPRGKYWRTSGSVGLLDTSIVAEGPYKGGAVMVGVRRSYLDVVMEPFVSSDTPLPSFLDAQLKMTFGDPRIEGRVTPMVFLAYDHLSTVQEKVDREDESSIDSFFIRMAAPYERQWGPLSLHVVPWAGTNQLSFTSNVNHVVEMFERPQYPAGIRSELRRDYRWGHLRTGLDLSGGYLTHFQAGLGHKGDILDQVNGETSIDWLDAAIWGESRFRLGRLDLKPGLRIEHYGLTAESVIDPRLALSLPIASGVTLRESLGRYHQPPTPGDIDPNGGNPNLKSSYFDTASLGAEIASDIWFTSLTGFYSDGQRLGVRTMTQMDFDNLGSLGPTFAELLEKQLGLAFYRENIGRAKNYGLELLAKRVTKDWFWLISYTLSQAQRTDDPEAGRGWRPFELDQRHNFNIAASTALTNWRIGARAQVVSGVPYSPRIDPMTGQAAEPYSGQLPMFFQLDFRADRLWRKCWGTIDLYFDIQNVTNRRNVEGRDVDELGMETDIRGLPILPFIGVEFIHN